MESKRVVEHLERVYWTCRFPEHRHSKQNYANKCIARYTGAPSRIYTEKELTLRCAWAARRALDGDKMDSIGKSFHVSKARAQQMVKHIMLAAAADLDVKGNPGDRINTLRRSHEKWNNMLNAYLAKKGWLEEANAYNPEIPDVGAVDSTASPEAAEVE